MKQRGMKRVRTSAVKALVVFLLAWCGLGQPALAAWPDRPLRVIVPFAPGGGSDFIARFIGRSLGDALHQSVIIENHPGAGGLLGVELGVRAPADGYT